MFFIRHTFHPVFLLVLFFLGTAIWSCKPEEEIITYDVTNGLEFSTDTVLFDTVFTGVGSATRRLKVFNRNINAVKVSSIQLGKQDASPYRILVNGTEPLQSEELLILGKDSILILVEVLIDPQDEDSAFFVNDSIVFDTNGQIQDVKLVAWGQDAHYLGNEVLECNSTWTKGRPYVLYGSVLVDTLCQLTIEAGTQIFAQKEAFLFAKGNIIANGTHDERITFRNVRLEKRYENIPGQWGGILLLEGSHNNLFNFNVIRNAEFGIRLGSPDQDTIPDVVVANTIIENMSNSGILAFTSDLYAENVLINNCMQLVVGNLAGGNYTYKHCTFANYGYNFRRETPSIFLSDNIQLDDNSSIVEDLLVQMQNSIVDGNLEDEIVFDFGGGASNQLGLNNSMFRSTIESLDTLGNILNEDPKFIDAPGYNYRLDTLSPAKDAGIFAGVQMDLDANLRDELPDLGAYERIE